MKGEAGGAWDASTYANLNGPNLNDGLARFIAEQLPQCDAHQPLWPQ